MGQPLTDVAILTYTSRARAVDMPGEPYARCCGMTPVVVAWPRHRLVRVSCADPACPLSEAGGRSADASGGVLGGDNEIAAKWTKALAVLPACREPTMHDADSELRRLLKHALADLSLVESPEEFEAYRIKYLGGKGLLKTSMSIVGQTPPDQKKAVSQKLMVIRNTIVVAFGVRKSFALPLP